MEKFEMPLSDAVLACKLLEGKKIWNINTAECIDQSDLHTCLKLIILAILLRTSQVNNVWALKLL